MILDAMKRTGAKCRVTFNYRYSPPRTQVKDILMAGTDRRRPLRRLPLDAQHQHGTDYFRRWHSQKKFSNGLMCHKATHHFDLVNWWLSAIPVSVSPPASASSTLRKWPASWACRAPTSAA